MIEQGVVTKIKGDIAYVEVDKKPQCDGCKACSFNNKNKTVILSLMDTECRTGDKVVVHMAQKQYIFAPILLFGVPLLLFLVGLLVGKVIGNELLMIIFGFMFAGLGIVLAALVDKSIRKNRLYMPTITDKILINEKEESKI